LATSTGLSYINEHWRDRIDHAYSTSTDSRAITVLFCTFRDLEATYGWAIYIYSFDACVFEDCLFMSCSSTVHGGAIFCDALHDIKFCCGVSCSAGYHGGFSWVEAGVNDYYDFFDNSFLDIQTVDSGTFFCYDVPKSFRFERSNWTSCSASVAGSALKIESDKAVSQNAYLVICALTGENGVDTSCKTQLILEYGNFFNNIFSTAGALLYGRSYGMVLHWGIFCNNSRDILMTGSVGASFYVKYCVFSGAFPSGNGIVMATLCFANSLTKSWVIVGVTNRPECPTNSPTASPEMTPRPTATPSVRFAASRPVVWTVVFAESTSLRGRGVVSVSPRGKRENRPHVIEK
jgi:hypothetical protein